MSNPETSSQSVSAKPDLDPDWYIECSDEEEYSKRGYEKGKMHEWEPEPQKMVEVLENYEKNGIEGMTLEWTCPAKRPLTPSTESEYSDSEDEDSKNEAKASMDFDFDNEDLTDLKSTPTLASSRKTLSGSAKHELTGSARKRTTNYNSVLSKMQRERKTDDNSEGGSSITDTPTK